MDYLNSEKNAAAATRRARGRPRDWDDKTSQNTIKSLDRAMEVFEHLSERSGQTLSGLAAELDQSPATVYRILVTLSQRDLVEFDSAAQLWHIGPRAFLIGSRFLRRTSLVERARPIMRRLLDETGETVNLGTVQGRSVLFVSQVETEETIRAFIPPGTLSPLHASGIGKALLADMTGERRAKFLGDDALEAFTPKTLTTRETLIADLRRIRERGYSVDDEERNLGMRCIASAVFDVHGEAIAGISISGPTSRMALEHTGRLGAAVMRSAAELTAALGGPRQLG